jgi:hypothetical protein
MRGRLRLLSCLARSLVVALLLSAAFGTVANATGSSGAVGAGCSTPPISLTCPGPIVTGFFPSNGPAAGGTVVTLLGTHFSRCSGVEAVLFDGVATPNFTVESDTRLTVITPSHAVGFASLTVQTRCGTSFPGLFTYT